MESLEKIIRSNLNDYPEWSEYNNVVLDFITTHTQKRPDMCIEGCKSLIEGISKLLYFNLDTNNKNLNHWKKLTLSQKFKKAVEILKLDGYEKEFTEKNNQLVFKLGEIRNERGDIAHGQAYPKNSYSNYDFAKFITLWTEGLCCFLLISYIAKKQNEESTDIYSEKQFEEFNDFLDADYLDIKYISYSKALKKQDPLQYEVLMDEYYIN